MVSNLNAVVLKLGGSVITFKTLPEKPNIDAVRRLSREIAEAGVERLVLVHGGGSFGHPMAQAYASRPLGERLAGLSATHVSMLRLNQIVVSSLLEAGVEAFPLHPSSLLRVRGGRVETLGLDLVQKLLDVGLTPVLYGDVVPDLDGDLRVVSGDVIASTLAVESIVSLHLFSIVEALRNLLNNPNPDDPLNTFAAAEMKYRPDMFEARVRRYIELYARPELAFQE